MAFYQSVLIGFMFFFVSTVSTQQSSYGQKVLSLNKLFDSAQKSQILTSVEEISEEEIKDIVRENLETALFNIGADFEQAAVGNVSAVCKSHLKQIIANINLTWAQSMLDALPKIPSGFFNGNLMWTGSYDECVNQTAVVYLGLNGTNATVPTELFKAKYCRAGVPLGPALPNTIIQEQSIAPGELAVGLCVPDTCSSEDLKNLVNMGEYILDNPGVTHSIPTAFIDECSGYGMGHAWVTEDGVSKAKQLFGMMACAIMKAQWALAYIPPQKNNFTITTRTVVCQKDELEYDARAIIVIILFSIILALMVLGTSYDVFVIHQLHLDSGDSPEKKSGGILANEPAENESRDIRYRVGASEQTPLLGGTSQRNIQDQQQPGIGLIGKILLAFSVYTNGGKILSAKRRPGTLGALDGVRFISMSWVILGHSFAFTLFSGTNLASFIPEHLNSFPFMAISNATVSVDSFFTLSGLLVSYLTLQEIRRVGGIKKFKWGLFYFHRFWRLTPPYMLVLALYVPLIRYWYNGPFWPQNGIEKDYCSDSWWKNILYINNFWGAQDTCMAWSWYLANDMQFYIISPLLLIPLYYSGLLGCVVCGTFLLMSCIWSGTLSSVNNYPMTLFGGGGDPASGFLGCVVCGTFLVMSCIWSGTLSSVNNYPMSVLGGGGDPAQAGNYFNEYYIRPYCRIGPYLVGFVFGYILYKTDCKVRMSRATNLLGWLIAAVCCLSVVYGPYGTFSGKDVSSREVIALYTALNRSVWALGLCWVIFSCATGHGGIVNWFLSWKFFIPLSRLTYISYLIHPVVIEVNNLGLRDGFYITNLSVAYLFVSYLVISNFVAFLLSLAFESPFMGLEKAIFNRDRKH